MRPLHDFDKSLRDPRSLIVENYAHLNHLWQYMRSIYAGYYKWRNIVSTMINVMNLRCENNDRQHFVMVTLPNRLPNLAMLKRPALVTKACLKQCWKSLPDPNSYC